MDLFEALKTRRSIRKYTDEPVSEGALEQVLEAARWAPSWANTQCWRFVVVRDPDTRARLGQTLMKVKRDDALVDNPATKTFNIVPVIIAVCAKMKASGRKPGDAASREFVTDKGDWFMFDTALAVENMCLAAHGLGLGTVIIGAFDAAMAEEILEIPPGYRAVVLLPLGIPARVGRTPPRQELGEIIALNRWDARLE
jgi:nitroreductase